MYTKIYMGSTKHIGGRRVDNLCVKLCITNSAIDRMPYNGRITKLIEESLVNLIELTSVQ